MPGAGGLWLFFSQFAYVYGVFDVPRSVDRVTQGYPAGSVLSFNRLVGLLLSWVVTSVFILDSLELGGHGCAHP